MKKITIIAGIVLFNPEISRLKKNISTITNQVEKIVLFDNGSSNIEEIKEVTLGNSKLILIQSKKNIGIAAALNRIFFYSKKNFQADFILTVDQDSVCPKNLICEYLRFYDLKIGIYTPEITDINVLNNNESKKKNNLETSEVKRCITSASLTSYDAWKSVNGFDETMFIDNVDFDFCKRIRKKGYKIVKVNSVSIKHEIGHITVHNTIFGRVLVKNHNSFRKYYIARNTIYMARKDCNIFWEVIACLRVAKQMLLVIMFEKNKAQKIKSLFKGTYEGKKIKIEKKWC